ncbi:hypothetical protein [Pedobacter sp. Leaf170]|uniref:hypothetical protein n=1 Tax=Pedobacter sp. Leaf170 TaxID=2876558 RepID=UPI001E467679|nr:hypothetical protein [Pedobacter sp. Leaf170]
MKVKIKNVWIFQLLGFAAAVFIITLLLIVLFSLPSFRTEFNLNSDSIVKIATIIAGISSPVVGIISGYLIYITLNRQTESNNDQREKNDTDIIFLMFNQMEVEYNNFRLTINPFGQTPEKNYYGYEALTRYANMYRKTNLVELYEQFAKDTKSDSIIYLTASYDLIFIKIKESSIPDKNKAFLFKKMYFFFLLKLEPPLSAIYNMAKASLESKGLEKNWITIFYEKYHDIDLPGNNMSA